MYPVAHIVVASGAAWGAERLVRRLFRSQSGTATDYPVVETGSLFDYRLVALGALLPDAIDKPLAWFVLRGHVEDDHLVAHTHTFALALAIPGLYLAWRGQSALISVASGVIAHRLCDPMWPETDHLLWPLNGWTFQHSTTPYFSIYMLLEIAAATVLFLVLRRIWLRDRILCAAVRGRGLGGLSCTQSRTSLSRVEPHGRRSESCGDSSGGAPAPAPRANKPRSNRPSLFDYRLVALGALLPDIIDKPLAWFILGDRVEDNHLFAHTMLFGLVLGLPGLYLAWRGNPLLISLACGVIMHLFCDPVLREPRTLAWPLYG